MNLQDYYYDENSLIISERLNALNTAIQYHGYKEVLLSLLKLLNSDSVNILSSMTIKNDIKILFYPYDTMITSSGNFYSEELGLYV